MLTQKQRTTINRRWKSRDKKHPQAHETVLTTENKTCKLQSTTPSRWFSYTRQVAQALH